MDLNALINLVATNLPEYLSELYNIAAHLRTHHTEAAQAKGEALQQALDNHATGTQSP